MAMIERTLRMVAKVPHTKMKNSVQNLQNPFSRAVSLVCILTQLRRLHEIDPTKTVVASIPKKSKVVSLT